VPSREKRRAGQTAVPTEAILWDGLDSVRVYCRHAEDGLTGPKRAKEINMFIYSIVLLALALTLAGLYLNHARGN
jgi:hypothetical protein